MWEFVAPEAYSQDRTVNSILVSGLAECKGAGRTYLYLTCSRAAEGDSIMGRAEYDYIGRATL